MITRRTLLGRLWAGAWVAAAAFFMGPSAARAGGDDAFSGTAYVGKTRSGRFRRFYINYWKPMRRIDGTSWTLEVSGLCERPCVFTLAELMDLPMRWRSSRLKCVECWSARARWGGFSFADLAALVEPSAGARAVRFTCGDGYVECLPLASLRREGVMFAHAMEGAPLSDEHGFPLRIIAPSHYGYKNPKAIVKMEFIAEVEPGTWSRIGPYSWDGTILPGTDHPLDFDKAPRRIPGGEIVDY